MFFESPNCRVSAAYLFDSAQTSNDLNLAIAPFAVSNETFRMILKLNITQLAFTSVKIRAFIGTQRTTINRAESLPITVVRRCTAAPIILRRTSALSSPPLGEDADLERENKTVVSYYKYWTYVWKQWFVFD